MSNFRLFESTQNRTVWNESDQKWYFVVADVVHVLADTSNAKDYIKKMRKRDKLPSLWWRQLVTPSFWLTPLVANKS
jgi:prophage antirepressor-like protein